MPGSPEMAQPSAFGCGRPVPGCGRCFRLDHPAPRFSPSVSFSRPADRRKLQLSGLPPRISNEVVREYFARFGEVVDVHVNKNEDRPVTTGSVRFSHPGVIDSVVAVRQHVIGGKVVQVERAMTSEEGCRIYVVCSKFASENCLRNEFRHYGTIEMCKVLRDKKNQSRGCAYVTFTTAAAAERAVANANGVELRGRNLKVMLSDERRPSDYHSNDSSPALRDTSGRPGMDHDHSASGGAMSVPGTPGDGAPGSMPPFQLPSATYAAAMGPDGARARTPPWNTPPLSVARSPNMSAGPGGAVPMANLPPGIMTAPGMAPRGYPDIARAATGRSAQGQPVGMAAAALHACLGAQHQVQQLHAPHAPGYMHAGAAPPPPPPRPRNQSRSAGATPRTSGTFDFQAMLPAAGHSPPLHAAPPGGRTSSPQTARAAAMSPPLMPNAATLADGPSALAPADGDLCRTVDPKIIRRQLQRAGDLLKVRRRGRRRPFAPPCSLFNPCAFPARRSAPFSPRRKRCSSSRTRSSRCKAFTSPSNRTSPPR